ncbi:MAG: Eco57I restriction-modification methylase domain-containing protein, partial [Prevotellaceae bacterium]|nr:Eco57I restriction-modification methylase domain-containing protein [Prevotellaceae bacterium]
NKSINDPDYARKLYLIEHCIYGVDIQPIAVQISKLRFFISLVVDQKPTNDAAHNFGIRPLPNLESKFVAANTLIPVDYDASLFESTDAIITKKEQLKELNHKIFLAKRNIDKQRLRDKIKETRTALAKAIEETGFVNPGAAQQLADWDMFEQNTSSPFFDAEWMFGVKGGFDIVIANPPFVSSKDLNIFDKSSYKVLYKTAEKQFDLYSLFIEKGIKLVCANGTISYIVPDSVIGRSNFSSVRNLIVVENTIQQWVHINNVFESAVVSNLIFVCQKQKKIEYSFVYIKSESIRDWTLGNYAQTTIELQLVKSDTERKVYFANQEKLTLQNKLLSSETFGDKCILWRGEEIGKSSDLISDCQFQNSLPIITGKEARRYILPHCNKWIDAFDVIKSLDNYKHHKILIRQVGSCINATIDRNGGVTTQSVYALYPKSIKEQKHLNAILGVLNSKLFDFFYKLVSGDKQMFARIILENIKALPYPNIVNPIIDILDKKVEMLLSNSRFDNNAENEIDILVYQLYGLSYDELLIVDPETPITREEYETT